MPTIAEALAMGLQHHLAGRLQAAEQIYRQVLANQPTQPEAWHYLGVARVQLGDALEGIACIQQALVLKPDWAEALNNLGNTLRELGQLEEAIACCRRALQLNPGYAGAHNNLGIALAKRGEIEEAIACYRRALELEPEHVEALTNLGNVLRMHGDVAEAVACCRRALQLNPQYAHAHNNLGAALEKQEQVEQALACFRRALELMPAFAQAHYNLGNALMKQRQYEDAAACYRQALELDPTWAEAHGNLSNALLRQRQPAEAMACCRRALQLQPENPQAHNSMGSVLLHEGKVAEAIASYRRSAELKPDFAEAHNNLAVALTKQGRHEEALACCRRALELNPDYADAHLGRALLWLLRGDWQQGWPAYEWRWQCESSRRRDFSQPRWDGGPLTGKTILLHAEQGLGDTIQFIRYAGLVKQRGGTVIVECQKPLLGLLQNSPGVDRVIERQGELPAFDVQAPLLSLPGIFQTSMDTVPADVPYLFAGPALVDGWHAEAASLPGFKVGIAWQGSPTHENDVFRSVSLSHFRGLAEMENVRLVSLQVGPGTEQLGNAPFPVMDWGGRFGHGSMDDLAAALVSLDLIITVDTAVAHLAGAMGRPVWVALPLSPDWRWLLGRYDSPWYPTMRLFRQREVGSWRDVFAEIEKALYELSGKNLLAREPFLG